MNEIAIFSTSIDKPTYGPVEERLNERGYDTWVYLADRVASGDDELLVEIEQESGLSIIYNDSKIAIDGLKSAWFRHPEIYNLKVGNYAKQLSLESEISSLQSSLWQQVPDKAWLNHPVKMKNAQSKLSQLIIARSLGFNIPSTRVANTWSGIDQLSDTGDMSDVLVKMPRGVLYEDESVRVLYATRLSRQKRDELEHHNPYPAIYQEFLQKKREWRVTVVADDVFPAAIYTADDAKDDWRRHQFTPRVEFKKEPMPIEEVERCIEYLGYFDLTYGAFDFTEDDDGKITFLECNTNGQYRWLEDMLGFPITDAITDQLIRIYNQN